MGARGQSIEIDDFKGGLNTKDSEHMLDLDQSPDLDNIVLLDNGWKKRQGDSTWNSSAMGSGSTAIQGLGYIKLDSGSEYLSAVAGTKFYSDLGLAGTMTDRTGALSITSGQNNIWTINNFNNLQIAFGGAPDAPFKYSGTGNAVALGGTPPSAATSFVANNRIFAISTTANPSRIYWPVLSNPEDWTGTGSGNADVSLGDGEALQCGVVIGPDTAILFKNSSTHLMALTRQPFPIYQLQKGIGIAGRYAWAVANGTIYFMTPGRRIRATRDGVNFDTFPNDIDDILDSINPNRLQYVQAYYYQTYEWIVFVVSTGSSTTNNYAIIWDIVRKCYLRCTTGFKANVMGMVQNRRWFAGHYNGTIYEKDKSTIYSDASETSPGAINAYWRTPYKGVEGLDTTIHPLYVSVATLTETSSVLEMSYGFDFTGQQSTTNFSIQATGGLWDSAIWDQSVWGGQNATISRLFIQGRGNLFSLRVRNSTASQPLTVQSISVRLRTDKARKVFSGV